MRNRASSLLLAALLAWFLFFAVRTGTLIAHSYNALPEMDAWEKVAHLDGYLHFPPEVLWQQHYEHRVLFSEVVLAFDWLTLRGREVLPMVLSALLDFGVWVVLVLAAWRSGAMGAAGWCGLLLAGIVMSWPGVAFVLSLPFLLQLVIYQFCSAAGLYALVGGSVGWTIVLGVIATYSSANGVFVWPVMVLFSLVLKLRRRETAAIFLAGAVSIGLFFVGYHNLGNSHPGFMFLQPAKFFGYFTMLLGMPFGAVGNGVGLFAGSVSLVLLAAMAYLAWRRQRFNDPVAVVGFGMCLLTLATALVTSASRIPIDRPFAQAIVTPGRYVNTSVHYWAALVLLLIWTVGWVGVRYRWVAIGVLAGIFAATLFRTGPWEQEWMGQYANYQYATLAIEAGLRTDQMAEMLNYADASLVQRSLPELERRHLALYSWDRYRMVGTRLEPGGAKSEIPGSEIAFVHQVPGGYRIIGWSQPRAEHLAVVDASGTVIGLGRQLPMGMPNGLPVPAGHADNCWVAFAGPSFRADQARYFIVP